MATHLIIPDPHAHPDHNNDRADYLSKLIVDLQAKEGDLKVINLGDQWDLPSLSGYDKGKKSFNGRSYKKDLDAGLDFDERMWSGIRKAKKRKPTAFFFEGNHEHRLKKALDMQYQELDGIMGFNDFDLKRNYNEIIEYQGQTPGIYEVDGVNYAHFFISGVMGRPISGEHPAYSLISKQHTSCTCGHIHVTDFATRTDPHGKRINGLVAGVFQDYNSSWAGEINRLWWRGVVVKRNVDKGNYDPEWISLDRLKEVYGE